jgi:hypothetical protein
MQPPLLGSEVTARPGKTTAAVESYLVLLEVLTEKDQDLAE